MEIVPTALASHEGVDSRSTAHEEHGVHDAMHHGVRSIQRDTSAASYHPVQNRLENWDETQRRWKLNMQRDTFGMGMPVRTMMERKIAAQVRACMRGAAHTRMHTSPCARGRTCISTSSTAAMARWSPLTTCRAALTAR